MAPTWAWASRLAARMADTPQRSSRNNTRYVVKEYCTPPKKNPAIASSQIWRLRHRARWGAAIGRGAAGDVSWEGSRYRSRAQQAEVSMRPPTRANAWRQ